MSEEQEDLSDVASRLTTHEEVCAYRYAGIIERLKRMEYVIYAVSAAICSAFLYMVVDTMHQKNSYAEPPSIAEPHRPTISK